MDPSRIREDQLRQALEHIRASRPLRESPLLELAMVGRRLAESGTGDTAESREWALIGCLSDLTETELARRRAPSAAHAEREAMRGADTSVLRSQLEADFAEEDLDREAWSALYHRYLSPTNLQVQEIAAVIRPAAPHGRRLVSRRVGRGIRLLAHALREAERAAETRDDDDRPALPSGTVAFLFTDIVGSTARWQTYPHLMPRALAMHDSAIREAVGQCRGLVFKSVGDALYAAFDDAASAIAAALAAQINLAGQAWSSLQAGFEPPNVRMAVHAGYVRSNQGDYSGQPLNRVARLLASAHGGQVLVSRAVADLARSRLPEEARLRDLGAHRWADLPQPEPVFQLLHPKLPRTPATLSAPAMRPHNLPAPGSRLVGRDAELESVRKQLSGSRLVTIVGAGGVGKTHLALELVRGALADYRDGAWLVELAPVTAAEDLLGSVIESLGIGETPGRGALELLVEDLVDRELLLLLDNCEQIVEASAELVDALLSACPRLSILATSREPLAIDGETVFWLGPLSQPPASAAPDPQELSAFAAVELFLERAREVDSGFVLDASKADAVASLVRRLDGLPLAIELAAVRVKMLTPAQIEARLDDRFQLLTGGRRNRLPRHQTLEAAIEWSYALLDETEKTLLQGLSVFRGSWSLSAAEALGLDREGGTGASTLDLLAQLVEKSLVHRPRQESADDEPRFAMLESIRHFAAGKLARSGRAPRCYRRHQAWCLELAERALPELNGPEQSIWLDRLDREHENLVAALEWRDPEPDRAELGCEALHLRLGAALSRFWQLRGHLVRGRAQLERLIADTGLDAAASASLARVLTGAGALAFAQGAYADATARIERGRDMYDAIGDAAGCAEAMRQLGNVLLETGDYAEAIEHYRAALEIWQDRGEGWGIAATLNNLGLVALRQGDYEQAAQHLRDSLERFRKLEVRWAVGVTLANLGDIALDREDVDRAERRYRESLDIARELEDLDGMAYALTGLGQTERLRGQHESAGALLGESAGILTLLRDRKTIAEWLEAASALDLDRGRPWRAARLLGAAQALREAIRAPLSPKDVPIQAAREGSLRELLSETRFDEALGDGRGLNWERALAVALDPEVDVSPAPSSGDHRPP